MSLLRRWWARLLGLSYEVRDADGNVILEFPSPIVDTFATPSPWVREITGEKQRVFVTTEDRVVYGIETEPFRARKKWEI